MPATSSSSNVPLRLKSTPETTFWPPSAQFSPAGSSSNSTSDRLAATFSTLKSEHAARHRALRIAREEALEVMVSPRNFQKCFLGLPPLEKKRRGLPQPTSDGKTRAWASPGIISGPVTSIIFAAQNGWFDEVFCNDKIHINTPIQRPALPLKRPNVFCRGHALFSPPASSAAQDFV